MAWEAQRGQARVGVRAGGHRPRGARAHLDTVRGALGAAPAPTAPVGAGDLVDRLARLGGA
ncbi:hypothetical protein, partial [Micromonospora parastrephiae]|uniref:hypothetical protein n=1 Tax=Micromonospora parastrephiae TaxID=2806101 RepID=UPI001EE40F2E